MTLRDDFADHAQTLSAPLTGGFPIVPDDGADLSRVPRAIMVGDPGDVAVTFRDGSRAVLPGLIAGVVYPLRLRRVEFSGTSAGRIVGLV
ncbi:hypothetical protein E2L08_08250 [Palleronia sediminis]|uniref:Uncharacterized protein n=1 Tax=Palleronia sediminis TaxID=2547833 RepID=A0A4R6AC10_9RHOB|nr:hypothetical protein [Palleronia sediminis]TDL79868.1 hypothetical protein E2L08_08250 [Palleronia sediminis]